MKNIKLGIVLFGVILAAGSQVFASYENSLQLYNQGKYQESLQSIAALLVVADDLKPESNNYKLRYLAGHNHWKLKSYDSALIHLKRCIDIQPKTVDPALDVAMILLELNRLNQARSYALMALSKDKNSAIAYSILGQIKLVYKNYWGAKEFFEKSLSLNTDLYNTWNFLGMTLMNLKKYSQANTAFSTAHAMNPGSAEILNNLAVSYLHLKNKDEADQAINKALKIAPNNEVLVKNKEKIQQLGS